VFKRPPTAQEAVLAELRRAIVEGELAPGTQIVQEALAERLGLSRVPIREALKILEGEGQVSYSPHRGYFVTELDLDELLEVYRIRQLLETEAATVAVPRLSEEVLGRMGEAIGDMVRASSEGNIVAMTAANRRFHFAIIESSGMPRLTRLVRQLWDATDPYRSLYYAEEVNRKTVDREHREILAAARDRDVDRVVALLDEHRDHAIARLRQTLGGQP
jgi:DNA-binding GntR family transcriptional regulator